MAPTASRPHELQVLQSKMALTAQMEQFDKVLVAMEARTEHVFAVKDSPVKLPAAELDLLKSFEDARDIMNDVLEKTRGDRSALAESFGGDCTRIGRVSICLDSVDGTFSDMNANDQRFKGVKNARDVVEQVLNDMGFGHLLPERRRTLNAEGLRDIMRKRHSLCTVTCPKCEATVAAQRFEEHELEECPERMMTCPKCQDKIAAKHFEEHQQDCPCRVVECTQCKIEVQFKDLAQHLEECPERIVTCPTCQDTFAAKHFEEHQQDCPCRVVECTQCKIEVQFKDLAQHLEECPCRVVECTQCKIEVQFKDLAQHLEECPERIVTCPKCQDTFAAKHFEEHQSHECQKTLEVMRQFPNAPKRMQKVVQHAADMPQATKLELLQFMQADSSARWFPKPQCGGHWVRTTSASGCQLCGKTVHNFDDGAHCSNGAHRICWMPCLFKAVEWEKMQHEDMEKVLAIVNR